MSTGNQSWPTDLSRRGQHNVHPVALWGAVVFAYRMKLSLSLRKYRA